MDKTRQMDVLNDAVREIPWRRDRQLGEIEPVSAARWKAWHDAVIREFPVNGAIRVAAARRDSLLLEDHLSIPGEVKAILRRKTESIRDAEDLSGNCKHSLFGLFQFSLRVAVVLAFLAIAGLFYFEVWRFSTPDIAKRNLLSENRLPGRAETMRPQESKGDDWPQVSNFASSVPVSRDQFNLRVTAAELDGLRSALLTAERTYPSENSNHLLRMRLDLSAQPILFDREQIGIP